jgi:hypothetical protein
LIRSHSIFSFILLSVFFSVAGADTLTIIAVGDIMMGSDYPVNMLPPNRGSDLYVNATRILQTADLTLGNLEGVLLEGGTCAKKTKKGKVYAFRMPPSFAGHLSDAGFDFMNLANNHVNDFGVQGITSTIRALIDYGIESGGVHGKVGEFEINGIRIAITSFATSPGTDLIFDITYAQKRVSYLAKENDVVIVSFHGGQEGIGALHTRDTFEYFLGQPRGNVVEFARAVVDSGADLVWGHGPHVPRAMELYKDRLIAYSLGNFCTWGFNLADERGYAPVLKVVLDRAGVFKHGNIISLFQERRKPLAFDTQHRAAKLIRRLGAEDFPESAPLIMEDGTMLRHVVSHTDHYPVDG